MVMQSNIKSCTYYLTKTDRKEKTEYLKSTRSQFNAIAIYVRNEVLLVINKNNMQMDR